MTIEAPTANADLKTNYTNKNNAYNKYQTTKTNLDENDDIVIYINLKNVGNGSKLNEWKLTPTLNPNDTEANFYYTSILGAGEVTSILVDSVELSGDIKNTVYKNFDFDLNITVDSAQVVISEDGNNYLPSADTDDGYVGIPTNAKRLKAIAEAVRNENNEQFLTLNTDKAVSEWKITSWNNSKFIAEETNYGGDSTLVFYFYYTNGSENMCIVKPNESTAELFHHLDIPIYRDGGCCKIKAVAVSKFNSIPSKSDSEKQLYDPISVSANHQGSVAPFNYYIDPDTGEYVFVNYDTLHSSSNIIEISFEKVEVFDVRDNTDWSIKPKTHIIYNMEETGRLGEATDIYTHYKYTEEDTEIDLYQLMKTQSSGEKLFIYYDGDKNPKYIDTVVNGTHTWRKVNEDVNIDDFNANLTNTEYSNEYNMSSGTEPQVITNPYTLDKTGSGISGKVDTEVNLDAITKTPAPDTGKGYGAQLYTIGQMNRYIDTSNLSAKGVLNSNGKLSDDYVYTCWSVNTNGICTQPWSLLFEEKPLTSNLIEVNKAGDIPISTERFIDKDGVEWAYELDEEGEIKYTKVEGAKILGVTTIYPNGSFHYDSEIGSNSSDISKMYQYVRKDVLAESNKNGYDNFWYVADSNADMRNTFGLNNVATDKRFNVGYYVVVAYPKDSIGQYTTAEGGADVTHYAQLSNEVIAHLYSRDEEQEQTSNRATDLPIMLSDYNWKGGGDSWYSNKYVDGEDKEGVLSVIDELKKTSNPEDTENYDPNTQQYLGGIVFHENYSAGYYNTCHKTSDDYSYNKGKYYQIVNVDDVMTALPYGDMTEGNTLKKVYGKPFTLAGNDYFYSRAVLAISEQDIDPFEDEKLKLTSTYIDAYKSELSLSESATLADAYKAVDSDLKTNGVTDGLDWVVYGWFAEGAGWEEIDLREYRTDAVKAKISAEAAASQRITMEEYIACMDKDGKYQITMNFMDKNGMNGCPYRIKIVHNSVAYDSDASFTLTTQLKVASERFSSTVRHSNLYYDDGNALSDEHPDLDSFRINLKNYSANTVTSYESYNQNPTKKSIYGTMMKVRQMEVIETMKPIHIGHISTATAMIL